MLGVSNYKRELQEIIDMLADTFKIACAIYDNSADMIVCTESYELYFGRGVYRPPIKNVFNKDLVINTAPGFSELCVGCVFHKKCPAVFEISKCFYNDNIPMGILFFASFSKTKNNKAHLEFFVHLIEQFAKLISSILKSKNDIETMDSVKASLKTSLNISNTPHVAVNINGQITAMNDACDELFSDYGISKKELYQYFPDTLKVAIMDGKKQLHYSFCSDDIIFRVDALPILSDSVTLGSVLKVFVTGIDTENCMVNNLSLEGASFFSVEDIKGTSTHIGEIRQKILRIANSPSTVFISGETGTGKGLLAKALHYESNRKNAPFVTVNCSSIPETLFESELFGYEEGAFTGAKKEGKPGKFELADGGTLFLDEISEIPLNIQVKLLNVLQERTFDRVGGTTPIKVDVRIIAASNRDLREMIQENKFRSDLFYRLNILPIHLLPLRDRQEDIAVLAHSFLNLYNQKLSRKIMGFNNDIIDLFQQFSWPGNIRQLQNIVEYCVNLDNDGVIMADDLPEDFLATKYRYTDTVQPFVPQALTQAMLTDLMNRYGWSVEGKKRVAQTLGISLRTLYRKMEDLGVSKPSSHK